MKCDAEFGEIAPAFARPGRVVPSLYYGIIFNCSDLICLKLDNLDDALDDLVDAGRYPIEDLGHPASRALIARCRAALAERQVCVVPGFLTPAALAGMAGAAETVAAVGYRRPGLRTC